ncbi:MAG: histidine phosphatase family protein [Fervidobacterium sp.]|uniref:histidine phosphatase family protein n=1 Tax=Fervidobacterium TaxID=2422 RepID=UPI0021FDFB00|nr:phosphoglycerate mutase [Fervidobacterium riparium]
MGNVYLLRHGSTEWNEQQLWQGVVDTELSRKGYEQVRNVARLLRNKNVSRIFSSPMKRALQSAKIIAEEIGYTGQIEIDNRLRECEIRLWNGKNFEQVLTDHHKEFNEWRTNLYSNVDGAESLASVQERMSQVLSEIIVHYPNENVIIVSHAIALRMLIAKVLGLVPPLHLNFGLDNASLSCLYVRDGTVRVKFLNISADELIY